jgi:hypothetical protein
LSFLHDHRNRFLLESIIVLTLKTHLGRLGSAATSFVRKRYL